MTILVTGAAGFIGFHVCEALLARGERVLGVDNLNDYYDVRLKQARLAVLQAHGDFAFARADIADRDAMAAAVAPERQSITGSSISRPRPGCATPWSIPTPTCRPT